MLRYTAVPLPSPIIVFGTIEDADQLAAAIAHGASDYLILPTADRLLVTRLQLSLDRQHSEQQAAWYLHAFNEMEKLADDLRLKILPLGIALSVTHDFDQLLAQIVTEAMAICNADVGTLYLRTEDDRLEVAIFRAQSLGLAYGGPDNTAVPFPPLSLRNDADRPDLRHVATYVANLGETVNVADVYNANEPFDFTATHRFDVEYSYRTISSLTVPLRNHHVIGVLQLLNAQDERGSVIPFDAYHQLVAESLASQATIVLHNHILTQRHEELLGYQREMEIARQLQADFLPADLPSVPGWDLTTLLEPARMVSGDFYDIIPLSDGKLCLVLADVCGKGLAAALFMALVRSILRAFMMQHHLLHAQRVLATAAFHGQRPFTDDEKSLLSNTILLTNEYIGRNHAQTHMFATLFCGILNPETGELVYVNAGHNPPLLLTPHGIQTELPPTGPALGLRINVLHQVRQAQLAAGDTLLAYTDGITDARSPDRAPFTHARLRALLNAPFATTAELVQRIMAAVNTHVDGLGRYDDITLLAARRLSQ
ncbi:MAG: SpoIIE family protein phosphatase [Anaerolineales bacterium]|nr:SpoIIE family protein phosphatase [Anaerolineales bacterium]